MKKDIALSAKEMNNRFIKNIDTTFKKWKPRKRYTMEVC